MTKTDVESGSGPAFTADSEITGEWDRLEREQKSPKKKEEQAEEQEDEFSQLRNEREAELNPKRSFLHRTFVLVKAITILVALAMGIGQLVGVMFYRLGPVQYVMRAYLIGCCVLVVFNEMEWTKLTRESFFLSNWICRGFIYSFIGVIGVDQTVVDVAQDGVGAEAALMYVKVVAWCMVAVGALYFAMGVLCCQIVSNRARADYDERVKWSKRRRKEEARSGGGGIASQLS